MKRMLQILTLLYHVFIKMPIQPRRHKQPTRNVSLVQQSRASLIVALVTVCLVSMVVLVAIHLASSIQALYNSIPNVLVRGSEYGELVRDAFRQSDPILLALLVGGWSWLACRGLMKRVRPWGQEGLASEGSGVAPPRGTSEPVQRENGYIGQRHNEEIQIEDIRVGEVQGDDAEIEDTQVDEEPARQTKIMSGTKSNRKGKERAKKKRRGRRN
ncbi:hypothetical protein BJX76DRAFT_360349 [Aspergillus varians]